MLKICTLIMRDLNKVRQLEVADKIREKMFELRSLFYSDNENKSINGVGFITHKALQEVAQYSIKS